MPNLQPPSPYLSAAPHPSRDILAAGAITGVIAGVVMALLVLLASVATGHGLSWPARLVAASFTTSYDLGRSVAVFDGVTLHLLIAAAWGILYAAIVTEPTTPFEAFFGGLFYGLGIWLVMRFVALPLFDPPLYLLAKHEGGFFLFVHLVFGAMMALLLPMRKWLSE